MVQLTFKEALACCLVAAKGIFPSTPTHVLLPCYDISCPDVLPATLSYEEHVAEVLTTLLRKHKSHGFTKFMTWMKFMKSVDAKWDHRKFNWREGSYIL